MLEDEDQLQRSISILVGIATVPVKDAFKWSIFD